MKKWILTLVLVFIPFFMCSCGGPNLEAQCKNNISDIRYNFFSGESDSWNISLTTGKRESPYVLDGKSEQLVDFGILSITPKNLDIYGVFTYLIEIDDLKFEGEFEKSPFDNSFAADIGSMCSNEAEIFVYISDGQNEEVGKLSCISKEFFVDAETSLQICINEYSEDIKEFLSNCEFEIYIKIITDMNSVSNDKFWYVMFLKDNGEFFSFIVDPIKSEIIAKNL